MESTRAGKAGYEPIALPFITTPFAWDLKALLILWPAWWLAGIEQFIVPAFAGWEIVRNSARIRRSAPFPPVIWAALGLAGWCVVPVGWVRGDEDLFIKNVATFWSQAGFLLLFWACIRARRDWLRIVQGLQFLAAYLAVGAIVFAFGIWRGEIPSLIRFLLPDQMVRGSAFFASIALRRLGAIGPDSSFLSQRLTSITLSYSALSLVALVVIPIMSWQAARTRGTTRVIIVAVSGALVFGLLFTQSRLGIAAFLGAGAIWLALSARLHLPANRMLVIGIFAVGIGLSILSFAQIAAMLSASARYAVLEWRESSWLVRYHIYRETIARIPEHPVAGWGRPVQLPELETVYSAGTHSSILGVLFQNGVVGLLLYAAIWINIWRMVIERLRVPELTRKPSFWLAVAAALCAFNIRELADNWWWDQTVTLPVWCIWGLVVTAARSGYDGRRAVERAVTAAVGARGDD